MRRVHSQPKRSIENSRELKQSRETRDEGFLHKILNLSCTLWEVDIGSVRRQTLNQGHRQSPGQAGLHWLCMQFPQHSTTESIAIPTVRYVCSLLDTP